MVAVCACKDETLKKDIIKYRSLTYNVEFESIGVNFVITYLNNKTHSYNLINYHAKYSKSYTSSKKYIYFSLSIKTVELFSQKEITSRFYTKTV